MYGFFDLKSFFLGRLTPDRLTSNQMTFNQTYSILIQLFTIKSFNQTRNACNGISVFLYIPLFVKYIMCLL